MPYGSESMGELNRVAPLQHAQCRHDQKLVAAQCIAQSRRYLLDLTPV